ncbi:recombination protein NinB [Halomonas sp. ATCH28]|uniref:Recombination protein NinB n=1 Tax=Halomonas gemina TaxID=2945105 RepID=A0ABT0T2Q2_9GAMM|nr:recombination protein NinB [Halomonas gemina]MCL7941200.1 recombination protein NinB [Halomonas gemina]
MSREMTYHIKGLGDVRSKMQIVWEMVNKALRAGAVEVVLRRPSELRSLSQNAKLWPMLEDVASQQQLVIDGSLEWASREDWKDVFTSALRRHQRMAKGIDGGMVVLGMRTSKMRKQEFSDLIELIYAYGAENGVQWSEKALEVFDTYREAREAA